VSSSASFFLSPNSAATALTSACLVLALSAFAVGCQKQDDHPPFAPACLKNCQPTPGISIGSSPGVPTTPVPSGQDGGTGTLTGQVLLLTDQSFINATLYAKTASVSADGTAATTATGTWDGATPYMLDGVASELTNWVYAKPDEAQGDALATYQAVATSAVSMADLTLVSSTTLDAVFTDVAALRSPIFSQVVLFFRSAGTGAPLAGLHVSLPSAQVAAYASSTAGWTLDDGTAVTDATGLVVFGNVETTGANAALQTVTVNRAATASAAKTFSVKVAEGAATIANVNVQL
jgi:hypothetical protein